MKHISKKSLPLLIAAVLFGALIVLKLLSSLSGVTAGSVQGIAADGAGRLYIGAANAVLVFDGETCAEKLRLPGASHSYRFFIDGDRLIVGRADRRGTKVFDLRGNYLADSELSYEEVRASSQNAISSGGRLYEFLDHGRLRPAEVRCDGKTVYRESLFDFLFSPPLFAVLGLLFGLLLGVALLIFLTDEDVKARLRRL